MTDGSFPNVIGDPAHDCAGNRINGGLTRTGNHAPAVLKANTVNGQLSCSGNTPAPTDSGNTGKKSGQCAGL